MSQRQSLRVELKPSFLLAGIVGAAHLLAIAAAAISLHGWPALVVAAGIALSGAAAVAEALHWVAGAARELELRDDERCAWRDGAGRWHEGRNRGSHFVSSGLIVVGLRTSAWWHKRIVLMADSSDAESLRRLRVWLRWKTESGTGGSRDEVRRSPGQDSDQGPWKYPLE
jgi:toxin CptA